MNRGPACVTPERELLDAARTVTEIAAAEGDEEDFLAAKHRLTKAARLVRHARPQGAPLERALVMAYLFDQARRFDEEAAEASVRGLVDGFAKEGIPDEELDQEEEDVDDDGAGDRASALFNAALAVARGDHAAPKRRGR